MGYKIIFKGIVQGVGFRPFIYRISNGLRLKGKVYNSGEGAVVEVDGNSAEKFLDEVKKRLPPLAYISTYDIKKIRDNNYKEFTIEKSIEDKTPFTIVSPDIAVCQECIEELRDSNNRRYKYPFINCTNCGPRFTIIKSTPYDRKNTTMAEFQMCDACKSEYEDPNFRRFHAQPNACPVCGPQVFFYNKDGRSGDNPFESTVKAILDGKVVAIKGLGGFHFACDARNNEAVSGLREIKRKNNKPFAMMAHLDMIEEICEMDEDEKILLQSRIAPIVLLKAKLPLKISPMVAPNQKYLGFMLPYTPLHIILMDNLNIPIVLTSANIADAPIIFRDEEKNKLLSFADRLLTHNRKIYIRCDDSVSRIIKGKIYNIRRSRGFVPRPIKLPFVSKKQILAVGGMLKNTFTLIKENFAFISPYLGDVSNPDCLSFEEEAIEHYLHLFSIKPDVIAIDAHPLYPSRHIAENFSLPVIEIQHHKAHIASCLAENGITESVIGVAMDGTGYGDDGKIWGGEFFVGNFSHLERIGQLRYIPLPSGDMAVREIYRFALSILYLIYGEEVSKIPYVQKWGDRGKVVLEMLEKNINSIDTSSAGRLFDAASTLLEFCNENTYEGEAPSILESNAEIEKGEYNFKIINKDDYYILDLLSCFKEMIEEDLSSNKKAYKFHKTFASGIGTLIRKIYKHTGIKKVALSGGVFQNKLLLELLLSNIENEFEVFIHSEIPPNDGGVSLGQAYITMGMSEKIRLKV